MSQLTFSTLTGCSSANEESEPTTTELAKFSPLKRNKNAQIYPSVQALKQKNFAAMNTSDYMEAVYKYLVTNIHNPYVKSPHYYSSIARFTRLGKQYCRIDEAFDAWVLVIDREPRESFN